MENKKDREENHDLLTGKHRVEIVVQDYGSIQLELDADIAPITVTNFINLVNEEFYDGITFHRIMDGFMIQGGDPTGTGYSGSDETIKGEFKANGIENNISHVRGVISMARSKDMNSASSQFFIVHEDSTFLDGNYAAFGKVLKGMEVVDEIVGTIPVEDDNGTVLKENQPIITSIRVMK
ncbi:MAG: peptidylprolyl isomerase [bacterium]|nr:peptidylprolyl isomerase [bacterium]